MNSLFDKLFVIFFILLTFLMGYNALFDNGFYSAKYGRYISYGNWNTEIGICLMLTSMYFLFLLIEDKK